MQALSIILDIVLILVSLVLIFTVLMQQGQRQGLGAIAGGADTFFGKGKARGLDAKLAKITKIGAIVFIVLAIATTIVVSHNTSAATPASIEDLTTEIASALNAQEVAAEGVEAEAETEDAAAEAEGETDATAETEAVTAAAEGETEAPEETKAA